MHHPDCVQCCQTGRCHFCLAPAQLVAHYEKDGSRFELKLCDTHAAWAASHPRSPTVLFDDAFLAESAADPVRKSEVFQSAVLATLTR